MRARMIRQLHERGVLVFAASLALYGVLACPYIVDGDNAELATLGSVGGASHPPGYPTDVLWLRAMSWLPGASAAHTAALATALLGALAAWAAYRACRAWGAEPLAATLVIGLYATGALALRYATEAEVFASNQLVVALILWLAAARAPVRGVWRAVLLAAIAGAGLAGQMTCALVAPIGLLGVVRGLRESRLSLAAGAALTLAAFTAGLAPYLYLFVAPDSIASWGSIHSWHDLIAHVLREDYGGPGAFSPHPDRIDVSANLAALLSSLGRAWWWALLAVGAGWLALRCACRDPRVPGRGEPRAGWIALAATVVLTGPLLVARFDIQPVGLGLYVCRRFHLMPILLLAPAIACGLDAVLAWIPAQAARVCWIVALAWIATSATRSLPEVAAVHSPAEELGVRDMLLGAPRDAVLIVTDEDLGFGAAYLELTEDVRRDVSVVIWPMTPLPWYRARLAREGITMTPGDGPASLKLARELLASGRPVLVDRFAGQILADLPSYPYGVLFRVLPAGSARPSVDELLAMNAALFDGWHLDYPSPGPDDELATEMHARYARTWMIIAQAVADVHGRDAARLPLAYARRFGPTP